MYKDRCPYAVKSFNRRCEADSNPSLSATQPGLQRKSAPLPPKYAENARISRLFPGNRTAENGLLDVECGHCPGFSPEDTCAVRFHRAHQANAMRSETGDSAMSSLLLQVP